MEEWKGLELCWTQTLTGHSELSGVASITTAGRLNTIRPQRPEFSSNQFSPVSRNSQHIQHSFPIFHRQWHYLKCVLEIVRLNLTLPTEQQADFACQAT